MVVIFVFCKIGKDKFKWDSVYPHWECYFRRSLGSLLIDIISTENDKYFQDNKLGDMYLNVDAAPLQLSSYYRRPFFVELNQV